MHILSFFLLAFMTYKICKFMLVYRRSIKTSFDIFLLPDFGWDPPTTAHSTFISSIHVTSQPGCIWARVNDLTGQIFLVERLGRFYGGQVISPRRCTSRLGSHMHDQLELFFTFPLNAWQQHLNAKSGWVSLCWCFNFGRLLMMLSARSWRNVKRKVKWSCWRLFNFAF